MKITVTYILEFEESVLNAIEEVADECKSR